VFRFLQNQCVKIKNVGFIALSDNRIKPTFVGFIALSGKSAFPGFLDLSRKADFLVFSRPVAVLAGRGSSISRRRGAA